MLRNGEVEIDNATSDWSNYFKAGIRGAVTLLNEDSSMPARFSSLQVLISGTVPPDAGMSSSAAIICASILAVLAACNYRSVPKTKLVNAAIQAERLVGVNAGGMDQAASVLGQRGSALCVSFVPTVSARPVALTESANLTVLVAQTRVKSNKHVTAPTQYNLRVVECTLAALVLSKITGVKVDSQSDNSPLGYSLRSFADAFHANSSDEVDSVEARTDRLDRLVSLVEDYLPQEEGYTREELAEILGIPVTRLEEQYLTKFPVQAERFKLRQRSLHVFGEALRVERLLALLDSTDSSGAQDTETLAKELGSLLDHTQKSCKDLYECSCPELDELCTIAKRAGSYGSRLMGAGWGGCSVHLVPTDKVNAVRQKLRDEYYGKRFPNMSEDELQKAIVESRPGSGSCLVNVASLHL